MFFNKSEKKSHPKNKTTLSTSAEIFIDYQDSLMLDLSSDFLKSLIDNGEILAPKNNATMKHKDELSKNLVDSISLYNKPKHQDELRRFIRELKTNINNAYKADSNGNTALHLVVNSGKLQLVELFLGMGDVAPALLPHANNDGYTPIDLAILKSVQHKSNPELFQKYKAITHILISKALELNYEYLKKTPPQTEGILLLSFKTPSIKLTIKTTIPRTTQDNLSLESASSGTPNPVRSLTMNI